MRNFLIGAIAGAALVIPGGYSFGEGFLFGGEGPLFASMAGIFGGIIGGTCGWFGGYLAKTWWGALLGGLFPFGCFYILYKLVA